MRKYICDFCKQEALSVNDISDVFAKHLPVGYQQICKKCDNKVEGYLLKRRSEHLKQAWDETARWARSFTH